MKRRISDWVQVHNGRTGWYDAKIVDERGKDASREVKIHYNGWKHTHDEWLKASSDRILEEDEELPLEGYDWGSKAGLTHQ